MKIIAHRGEWMSPSDKNSLEALTKALNKGFGIETDIRDYAEELVISHNIATNHSPKLEDFLKEAQKFNDFCPLALNVKADGIQEKLNKLLTKYSIENYFLFDMSIPEMVVNQNYNFKCFTRNSDIESECVLYPYSKGVWLDCFFDESWISYSKIISHLSNNKMVCVVSPELHGFNHTELWKSIKETGLHNHSELLLCTDLPNEAKEYFCE